MCQALLEKIKYDLIIARGNESFDVRYTIDVAHAADLPINSLVRACVPRVPTFVCNSLSILGRDPTKGI